MGYWIIFKLIIVLCVLVEYIFLDELVFGLDVNYCEIFY